MLRTLSITTGKGSLNHNDRKFTAQNVDAERTKNNITYCNENIKDIYHKLFNEALDKFNARQTRKDRMIDDYYEKKSAQGSRKNYFTKYYCKSEILRICTQHQRTVSFQRLFLISI